MKLDNQQLKQAIFLLQNAKRLVVLTGAGVSAESGIQTFRDAQSGMWTTFDPMKLASQEGFAENPGLVWRWYMARLKMLGNVQPNPAHLALAQLQRQKTYFTLITQNVDDLHERAGNSAVLHVHGSIVSTHCNECGKIYAVSPAEMEDEQPPLCPSCAGKIRPSVVWFGEILPEKEMRTALDAVRNCDCMLVVGTSGVVYPVAELPSMARRSGAAVIDVNPERSPISEMADCFLQGKAGEIVPRLLV